MDFGFGNLIGKIEEHFGKIVTRVLLGAVSLAVLLLALKVIVTTIAQGLTWTGLRLPEGSILTSAASASDPLTTVLVVLMIPVLGLDLWQTRRRMREMDRLSVLSNEEFDEFLAYLAAKRAAADEASEPESVP